MSQLSIEASYLIHLLSCALRNSTPEPHPKQLDWYALYRLAVRHCVSNMAGYSVEKLEGEGRPPDIILTQFQTDVRKGMAKEAVQHVMTERILKAFESSEIDCLPLKGILIRSLYPKPDMRQMADIDILFKHEQTKQVNNIMSDLGFNGAHLGGNHDVYHKRPYMNIEMHRRLIAESSPYYTYLSKTWDRAVLHDGSKWLYRMTLEDEWIYLLIHLTKHYARGGTGIRSVMDIWVYLRRYRSEMNWRYIQAELEQIRLDEFAHHIIKLGDVWFDGAESEELHEKMSLYIIASGAYGTRKHGMTTSRLPLFFPPLSSMKIRFPILKKLPILLPFCWLARALHSLMHKREHTLTLLHAARSITRKEAIQMKQFHQRVGLMKRQIHSPNIKATNPGANR